jgi:cyanophycinase
MKLSAICIGFALSIFFQLTDSWVLVAQEPSERATCEFFERYGDWPEDLKTRGSVLIADSHAALDKFFVAIDKQNQQVKEIILVGSYKDCQPILASPSFDGISKRIDKVTWINDLSRVPEPHPNSWLFVCDSRFPDEVSSEQWQKIAESMRNYLANDSHVGFVGPAAVALGNKYPKRASKKEFESGIALFPSALIDFNDHGHADSESLESIAPDDRLVLLSIAKGNAVLLQGRKAILFGDQSATVSVVANKHLPAASQEIQGVHRGNARDPESILIDWTQWRRQAIERTLEPFPPMEKQVPSVPNGSLVIVGGGGMPSGLMQKFVELAGGPNAQIVYVPCAEEEDMSKDTQLLRVWEKMGAKTCSLIHTKDRRTADRDEAFLEPLKNATGVWFGGGRQWNLADSYYGTQAHRLMKQCLDRGGVIGGSSAGASIQANYLARATPIGNFKIMAPGYERGGLGFILGVAIDQHFSQRKRQKDLLSLVETYPQMLGIGIDETTAIVVKKSTAEIFGPGTVTFNWKESPEADIQEFVGTQGQRFDLAQRAKFVDQEETSRPEEP